MVLTIEESHKLKQFSDLQLGRNQVEIILGRELTDKEWKSYTKDYRKIVTAIAKQAAKLSTKKGYLRSIHKPDPDQDLKNKYKDIATQTAKVAYRKFKTDEEPANK